MAERIRCPNCNALNQADVDWCSQCLLRFRPAEPETPPQPEASPEPATAEPGATGSPIDPLVDPLDTTQPVTEWDPPEGADSISSGNGGPVLTKPIPKEAVGTVRGAFRVTENGVLWACKICDTENPLDQPYCSACGATLSQTLSPDPPERPQKDPGTAALLSIFLPGAGHAYLGMWGQAVARAVVAIWVAAVVVISIVQEGSSRGSFVIPAIFTMIAFLIWFITAHDAYMEASNQKGRVLLKPRHFTWAVVGLMIMMVLMFIVLIGRVQGT